MRWPSPTVFLLTACGAAAPTPATPTRPPEPVVITAPPPPPAPVELPEGAEALLAELDALPFPSLEGRSLVRVHTGRPSFRRRDDDTLLGWLIEEDEDRFSVVHALSPTEYRIGTGFGRREVGFERASLAEALEQALIQARAEVESDGRDRMFRLHRGPGPRLEAIFFARGAIANGREREGRELLALALRMEGPSMPLDAPHDPADAGRGDVALHLSWLALRAYGDDELDRPALRDRLTEVVERFDGTEAAVATRELLVVLDRMIEDDATGPTGTRAEQLVFALRDHAYGDARRELSDMGLAAVPALIDALEDDSLTRLIDAGSGLPSVQRVSDVARGLLMHVSGESFRSVAGARAWYADVQRLGEAELLARDVRAGSYRAVAALRRLLQVDRRRGVREGTRAASAASEGVRASLIGALAEAADDVPARFFLRELGQGSLSSRVQAAQALRAQGDERWIAPMVEQLRARLEDEPEQGQERAARRRNPFDDMVMRQLLDLLLQHGGDRGLEALAQLYPRLGAGDRLALVLSASRIDTTHAEARARVDAILELALADPAAAVSQWAFGPLADCVGTVGDTAAVMLAERVGAPFDCTSPPEHRARARAALANRLRLARGEEELPAPPPAAVPAIDPGELDAAELAFRTAETEDAMRSAVARFSALGPGAAPRLMALVEPLPEGHETRALVEPAAAQLASMVTAVEIDGGELDAASAERLRALSGEPLDGVTLARTLSGLIAASPRGALTLQLHRDGAGRGVRLHVQTEPAERRMLGDWAELSWATRRGGAVTGRESDHLEPLAVYGLRGYATLVEKLDEILRAPPSADGEAHLRLRWAR